MDINRSGRALANEMVKRSDKSNYSLADGLAGDLLVLLNFFNVERDPWFAEIAEKLLRERFPQEITINAFNTGLWTGLLGLSLSVEKWAKIIDSRFWNATAESLYQQVRWMPIYLLQTQARLDYEQDLVFGRAGVLNFLTLSERAKEDSVIISKYKSHVKRLLCSDCFGLYSYHPTDRTFFRMTNNAYSTNSRYIVGGMAHGIIGEIASIIRFSNIFSLDLNSFYSSNLKRTQALINAYTENEGRIPILLRLQDLSIIASRENHRLSWCYGLTGVQILCRSCEEFSFASNSILGPFLGAQETDTPDKSSVSELCLCHGLTGILYAQYLSGNIGAVDIMKRYPTLFETKWLMAKIRDCQTLGLLDGIGGVCLFLLACQTNTRIQGDGIFGYTELGG